MFKRVQKANATLYKRARRGEAVEDEGPRELALDEDTDSESESESSSSSSSASSSSRSESGGQDSSKKVNGAKRARAETTGSDSDDESSEDDSDSSEGDSDSSEGDSDSSEDDSEAEPASKKQKTERPPLDPLLRPSISRALAEPIYVKPDAIENHGHKHRSCYLCPAALLKTETMVTTHRASGSHGRRLKRFNAAIGKLTADERKDPADGGLDVVTVVERVDAGVAKKQQSQLKHKKLVQAQKKEAKGRRMEAKKKRRAEQKEIKMAKRQVRDARLEEYRKNPEAFRGQDRIRKDGRTVREAKEDKVKAVPLRHRVMPTKEERKIHKRIKREERGKRLFERRNAKREAKKSGTKAGTSVATEE